MAAAKPVPAGESAAPAAPPAAPPFAGADPEAFRSLVRREGARLYRDLPWRNTRDPYAIWLSEVMLQQTQVSRVEKRMPAWLERFPSVEVLAEAPVADVLAAWQGMGYNRRALALKAAAEKVVSEHGSLFPQDRAELIALPGIGPATAQGIRAFAFDLPGVYLETNVRSVFLHHFFPDAVGVPDRELVPLIEATCPDPLGAGPYARPQDEGDTPRSWYYALLDYGAHLKQVLPNPSRRSASHARQSAFEGSYRQKRSRIVKELLAAREAAALDGGSGALSAADLLDAVNAMERDAGRPCVDIAFVEEILGKLAPEGFCREDSEGWAIA